MDHRIQRLQALLRVNQNLEKEAKYKYLKARQLWLDEMSKSQTLNSFKSDYRDQLQMFGKQGAQATKIRQIALFINQLDKSIDKQSHQIEDSMEIQRQKELEYIEAKRKTMSVQSIIDKLMRKYQRAQDKLSQKENDEYAQNIWYSNDKKVP